MIDAQLSRLAVDDVIDLLSQSEDRELQEIVDLVSSICGGAAAGITLRRGDEFHLVLTSGIDSFVCPAEETFCRVTMETDDVFVVEDAVADPRFAALKLVDGTLGRMRFYASAPVYAPTGAMIGRLCVIDEEPRRLGEVQRSALSTLAGNVTELIELRLLRAQRTSFVPASKPDAATLLSQIGAELSHDLRVPLTSVVACLEMLQDELGPGAGPTVTGLLQRATGASGRMVRMLEQHLDRPGDTERDRAVTDLGRVARQVVDDCHNLLAPIRAVVVVDDLPSVLVDPDDLYSVFQNLVSNSVKFRRPDTPLRVHITSRSTPDGWRVVVQDNGVGIPADRRVDVFNLFSRVHDSVAGHGIGLATVARIINACGGHVGAEEPPGGGTTIWFELPHA